MKALEVPVELMVLGFALPDRLGFRPELNAYEVPSNAMDYYRPAQQNRCILNCWKWEPTVRPGAGKAAQVEWDEYDRTAGQLLSGEAFGESHRPGVPVECMYLPFDDSGRRT